MSNRAQFHKVPGVDPDDLVAETFLVCLIRSEYLQLPEEETRALLESIVKRKAIDRARRRRNHTGLPGAGSETDGGNREVVDAKTLSPLEILVNLEAYGDARVLWHDLCSHLNALRVKLRSSQKEALDAYLDGDGNYAAAASRAGLSVSQLTQRIHTAVQRIYQMLDDKWRLHIAPLRSLQLSSQAERALEGRANERLIELLARQARKQVLRELEDFVSDACEDLPASRRAAFKGWVESGGSVEEIQPADRPRARRAADDLVRSLTAERPVLLRLLRSSLGRNTRRPGGPGGGAGSGPGAESSLVRWCRRHLLHRLEVRSGSDRPDD